MITEYAAGRISFDDLRLVTFGQQEHECDFHFNMFTPQSLVALLAASGLVDARLRVQRRPSGAWYEMEIAASKSDAEPSGTG
jgi:hypothetical protein